MKKILTGAVLAFALFIPGLSFAQTLPADVDAQSSTQVECVDLKYNLKYRTRDAQTNDEVSVLQDLLVLKGYLEIEPTGYFGIATFAAAKKLQASFGMVPTGFVGTITRGKIKAATCGGATTTNTTPPPISTTNGCTGSAVYSSTTGERCGAVAPIISNTTFTVISPNSGTYKDSDALEISWTPYLGDFDFYTVMLGNKINGSETNLSPDNRISKYSTSFSAKNIPAATKSISGSTINGVIRTTEQLKDSYYIAVYAENSNGFKPGTRITSNIFSVIPTAALPTSTVAGCTGGAVYSSTTGQKCDTSTPATATSTITVLSPNGGEKWVAGTTQMIKWSSVGLSSSGTVDIVLADTRYFGDNPQANSVIIRTANTGSYAWTIPQQLNPSMQLSAGSVYKLSVRSFEGRTVGAWEDVSDSLFSIAAPATTTSLTAAIIGTPTLALGYSSVDGGETLVGKYTVKITAGATDITFPNYSSYSPMMVDFSNERGRIGVSVVISTIGPTVIPAGTSATYNVTINLNPKQMFGGQYKFDLLGTIFTLGNVTPVTPSGATTSNFVTIIGETSPYITSAVYNDAYKIVYVSGSRLNLLGSSINIDGVPVQVDMGAGPTSLSLNVGVLNLVNGSHTLQITNSTTGNSNVVYFAVAGATIMSPTVTISGTPLFALGYSSVDGGEILTATFSVNITAGSEQFMLYKPGSVWKDGWTQLYLSTISSDGKYSAQTNNASGVTISQIVTYNAIDGGSAWQIPPGQSSTFKVTQTFKPSEMFAGAYTASLLSQKLYSYSNASNPNLVPANKTNAVTIIGETSPYVSGVRSDAKGNITISGARLGLPGQTVFIDGKQQGDPLTALSGNHYLQIINSQIGNSNIVNFTVAVTATTTTTCPQSVTINGTAYTLSPCSISMTMTDGQGDKNFTSTILGAGSYGFSVRGYGVGFPTYGIIPNTSSGGANGNANLSFTFKDSYLTPGTYTGYIPVHIFQGSEGTTDNNFLNLNVNLTVN